MARLRIYAFPDTVLTQKALPILKVEERHRVLANDMLETMYDAPGIGLAANQVGVLERIIVVDTDFDCEDYEEGMLIPKDGEVFGGTIVLNKNSRVFLNPVILSKNGKTTTKEGCLSVPEYTAEVDRAKVIELEYLDLEGKTQVLQAEGLLAICIQHEIDHLEGKLFIDRLSPLKKDLAQKKLRKDRLEREKLSKQML
jgi:peptide deformylase